MMQQQVEAAPVVPLWINGHAYLTVPAAFYEVRNRRSGEVLRRTPLCDAGVAQHAVAAARAVQAAWAAQSRGARAALLDALAAALSDYAGHFAALLAEETDEPATAAAEVAQAVTLLRGEMNAQAARSASLGMTQDAARGAPLVGIVGAASAPLYGALCLAVPALLAGAVVIVKPSPATPSALYALAELTARCHFPGGVFSVVQGGESAIEGLRGAGVEMLGE
jgi:succinate-semialdehyde dehydrogenase / glutarate-semialdehyde dehydrogenase